MYMNKNIGILGGTFDPIHMGHLLLAETARDYFSLDEVLFIPTGNSYLKENVTDSKNRLTMLGTAIEENPYFALSTMEIDRAGNSYSSDTLKQLKEQHPDNHYYFIVGADAVFSLEEWHEPGIIFANCTIAAAVRKGYSKTELADKIEALRQAYQADIRIFPMTKIEISSTEIRERIQGDQTVRYMITEKTEDYIKKHNLYQKMNDQL